jgi:ADP-ribosylglycohydrolase
VVKPVTVTCDRGNDLYYLVENIPMIRNTRMDTTGEIKNRFKGVLFGQAVGDALGLGAEFMSKDSVKHLYPNGLRGYDQIIQDSHRKRWKKGAWTDDTDQMTMILDSFLEMRSVEVQDIARRFWNWAFVARGEGIGHTTYLVLKHPNFMSDPHSAALNVWEDSGRTLAANGGVMRSSVVGLWDFNDRDKIQANAEAVCRITHADPRCIGSCVVLSLLVNELVKGRNADQGVFNEMIVVAGKYDKRIRPFIEKALKADTIASLELDNTQDMGYTLKTLAAGIWALTHANSFEEGLLAVIHEGGDADTNGAVAGALLGAKFGMRSMPSPWIEELIWRMYMDRVSQELFLIACPVQIESA